MALSTYSRLSLTIPTLLAAVLTLSSISTAQAQSRQPMPEGVSAVVNGRPIPTLMIDVVESQFATADERPTRDQILEQLIDLEVLTQVAEQSKLEEVPETAAALQLQYAQTMANAYLGVISDETDLSDEELRAEYDKQLDQLEHTEYRASHILVESETEAQQVITALQAGGDFAKLAQEFSTGPTADTGGDLGWFDEKTMVPEFTEAVKLLDAGEFTSEPVQTQFGWHVIWLAETRSASVPNFETVKEGIRNLMTRNLLNQRVADLREQADVQR